MGQMVIFSCFPHRLDLLGAQSWWQKSGEKLSLLRLEKLFSLTLYQEARKVAFLRWLYSKLAFGCTLQNLVNVTVLLGRNTS